MEYSASGTTVYATGATNIRLGNRSGSFGDVFGGMRFTTVPIPQGATISSAYINVNTLPDGTASNSSNQVRLKIYAEAVDNSTQFNNNTVVFKIESLLLLKLIGIHLVGQIIPGILQ